VKSQNNTSATKNRAVKTGSAAANAQIPVLHIIKSLGRGGAEMLLPETLSKHDRNKFEFHYIYFVPWKHQMVTAIEQEGGKVTCISAKNNFKIILQARKIAKYIKDNNIRLIHCHLPWAGIVGRIAGKIAGVPVVYTEHNKWERYHKLTYYLNKLSFKNQELVIAVSEDVAESIKKHHHNKRPLIQVVSNGINVEKYKSSYKSSRDIKEELRIAAGDVVIGIICVFRKQKRLDVWLEIAKALHQKCPQTRFIIVGDGPLREELHDKARSLQMQDYLHFAGLQVETRPYLQAMDIFMMSSEFEGLPIALLEAMSMGCMPACTDAGGIRELVKNNSNGILVPVNNPMQLVERLVDQVKDIKEIKILGSAARETVIHSFSMQKMVNELETIYTEIIN
jgi:glycosyltransferase involved in cell wall biosynthesis